MTAIDKASSPGPTDHPSPPTTATDASATRDEDSHVKEFNVRSILTLTGAFCALFCTLGFQNAFGIFQEYYGGHELSGYSDFEIAWIGSVMTFMLFSFAAPAGLLVDRIGPTPLLFLGSTGTLVAMFMTSLCKKYYQFLLAQGILLGMSSAFLMCPALATVSNTFSKHRGAATGITIAGSSIGGIIWPILLDRLLNYHQLSFGWTFRIVGFMVLGLCIIITAGTRKPVEPDPGRDLAEADRQAEQQGSDSEKPKPKKDLSILKKPAFILLCVGSFIGTFGLFTPIFFISVYAAAQGLSTSLAFHLVSILNGASFVGRVSTGFLADKYGNFNLCFMSIGLCGIVTMCWTEATTTIGIIFFALAFGYTSGAMFSLQTPCAVQLATEQTRGTAIGMLFMAPVIPGLVSPPIGGRLVPHGYLAMSMYAGVPLLVASGFILCARLCQSRKLFIKV